MNPKYNYNKKILLRQKIGKELRPFLIMFFIFVVSISIYLELSLYKNILLAIVFFIIVSTIIIYLAAKYADNQTDYLNQFNIIMHPLLKKYYYYLRNNNASPNQEVLDISYTNVENESLLLEKDIVIYDYHEIYRLIKYLSFVFVITTFIALIYHLIFKFSLHFESSIWLAISYSVFYYTYNKNPNSVMFSINNDGIFSEKFGFFQRSSVDSISFRSSSKWSCIEYYSNGKKYQLVFLALYADNLHDELNYAFDVYNYQPQNNK